MRCGDEPEVVDEWLMTYLQSNSDAFLLSDVITTSAANRF